MDSKKLIYLTLTIGLFAGGYLPLIWGGSTFSFSSIFLSAVGGIAGIYVGFKLTR